jgi:hypothetical protein
MLRRSFIASSFAVVVTAGLPLASHAQQDAIREPIRIGFLTVRSGPLAAG